MVQILNLEFNNISLKLGCIDVKCLNNFEKRGKGRRRGGERKTGERKPKIRNKEVRKYGSH
jgi:hypothetical protein